MEVTFSKLANIDVTDSQLAIIEDAFGTGWAEGSHNMCVSVVQIKEYMIENPDPEPLIREIYESLKLDTIQEDDDGFDVVFHRVKG